MLNTMRKISGGILAKLLMLLLVISFAAWGVGDILRSSGSGYVAKIGDETVTTGEFSREAGRVSRELQAKGMNIPDEKIQMLVLQQLVQRKLVAQTVEKSGLYISDATATAAIATDPQFKNMEGKFSDTAFRNYLKESGQNDASFLQQMKLQLGGTFLMDSMSMRDITPPVQVLKLDASAASETRDVVLITVPVKKSAASDADIEAYYNEYKSTQFVAPERRTLEYVSISAADVQALVDKSITPEMRDSRAKANAKLGQDAVLAQLRSEQRDSVMRELSNNIEDALASGATMGDSITKAGLSATSKTLTNITAADYAASNDKLLLTVATQGFQLSSGETSNLLTTPDGRYVLVAVKSVTPVAPKSLAEVKGEVAQRVAAEQAHSKALATVNEIKIALAKGPDWQAALAPYDLPARMVSRVTRPGEKGEKSPLPTSLAQAVFEQPVGKTAGPFTTDSGEIQLAYVLASHATTGDPSSAAMASALNRINATAEQEMQSAAFDAMAKTQGVRVNPTAFNKAPAE